MYNKLASRIKNYNEFLRNPEPVYKSICFINEINEIDPRLGLTYKRSSELNTNDGVILFNGEEVGTIHPVIGWDENREITTDFLIEISGSSYLYDANDRSSALFAAENSYAILNGHKMSMHPR